MTLDLFERMVRIPVQVVEGRLTLLDGAPLPILDDGASGELMMPLSSLSREARKSLTGSARHLLLGPESRLLALVRPRQSIDGLYQLQHSETVDRESGLFAPIVLLDPLELELRPGGRSRLHPCRCALPTVSGRVADSVNEAYSILVERHEPHRRSRTGNVFQKVYCSRQAPGGPVVWAPLEEWRASIQDQLETQLWAGLAGK